MHIQKSLHEQLKMASTMEEVMAACDGELKEKRPHKYDESVANESQTLKLNPYLTDKEADDARFWANYMVGVMLLHGQRGSYKGSIGNRILKLAKWYYDKNILMDYRPRELFDQEFMPQAAELEHGFPVPSVYKDSNGLLVAQNEPQLLRHTEYVPFGKAELLNELSCMSDVALGGLANEDDPELEKIEKSKAVEINRLTGLWIARKGIAYFQNGILALDEIKRYHYKRRPHNPFGIMLTQIYDVLRHCGLLCLGMTVDYDELDEMSYLPKVDFEIQCHKVDKFCDYPCQHTGRGMLYRVAWIESKHERVLRLMKKIWIDGREPQELLGGYASTELLKPIDMWEDEVIYLKDSTGFRNRLGAAYIEDEYIGYLYRTDDAGYTFDDAGYRTKVLVGHDNEPIRNALVGITRRLNWTINKRHRYAHDAGATVFTGKGWFDIYNSWMAVDIPAPKSLMK